MLDQSAVMAIHFFYFQLQLHHPRWQKARLTTANGELFTWEENVMINEVITWQNRCISRHNVCFMCTKTEQGSWKCSNISPWNQNSYIVKPVLSGPLGPRRKWSYIWCLTSLSNLFQLYHGSKNAYSTYILNVWM